MKRKTYFALLASSLCFFPKIAIGASDIIDGPLGPIEGNRSGVYASVLYDYNFYSNIGRFTGAEDAKDVTTAGIYGKDPSGLPIPYAPEYTISLVSGTASIGYRLSESSRIELEGGYVKITKDTEGYSDDNNAQYVELKRDGSFLCTTPTATCVGTPPPQLTNAVSIVDKQSLAFKIKNDSITNLMFMGNLLYELRKGHDPLFFFVGIGAGLSRVTFLGLSDLHFAFQGKLGFGFEIIPSLTLTLGYKYFALLEDSFKDVLPTSIIGKYDKCVPAAGGTSCTSGTTGVSEDIISSTSATITHPMGFNGLQVGVTFQF